MRIYYTLLLIAAGFISSCSLEREVEERPSQPIAFFPFEGNFTKAQTTIADDHPPLMVYAYESNGAVYFIDDFAWDDAAGAYESEYAHYWPSDNAALRFIVYDKNSETYFNGASMSSFSDATTVGAPGISLQRDIELQHDMIVAHRMARENNMESGKLSLNFRHILSQVSISARNANPAMKVEVLGVRITGVSATAGFKFPTSNTDANNDGTNTSNLIPSDRWSSQTGETSYMSRFDQAVTLTTGADTYTSLLPDVHSFMLIPQTLTPWNNASESGARISVLCRISEAMDPETQAGTAQNWRQEFPPEADKFAFTSVAISGDWEPGKAYSYQLTFFSDATGGGGLIDPDQIDPTAPQPDEDIDDSPGDDYGSVVGGEITVYITSIAWSDDSAGSEGHPVM